MAREKKNMPENEHLSGPDVEIDLDLAKEFLTKLVLEQGEILSQRFGSGDTVFEKKGSMDVVAEADIVVARALRKALIDQFSQAVLLMEDDSQGKDFDIDKEKHLFVVDPIDGTTNYLRGDPNFATSVALVQNGQATLGVTHAPLSNQTFWAQKGVEGAYKNGERIKVSEVGNLKEASVVVDWPYDFEIRQKMHKVLGKLLGVRQIKSPGCAVTTLTDLAEGKIDAYCIFGLKPWDLAAAAFIAKKAGAAVSTPEGGSWGVLQPDILVSNPNLHADLLKTLSSL